MTADEMCKPRTVVTGGSVYVCADQAGENTVRLSSPPVLLPEHVVLGWS